MNVKELFSKISTLPSVDYWGSSVKLEDTHKNFFVSMIQNRINHCEEQLNTHLHEAKSTPSGQIIVWEGGHFAVPVWTALVWEQIIRQMGREQEHFDAILWDIASEGCMCNDKEIIPESF